MCIGKFDGVHIAHQALLLQSDVNGGVLIVGMDHTPSLTPKQEDFINLPVFRIRLEEVREMGAGEFAAFLCSRFPKLKKIIVGYDFRFGKNRSCVPQDLGEFFEVCVMDEICLDGISVHRQAILSDLVHGNLERANQMLGRCYEIKGHIIKGQGRGREECVPTLNLEVDQYALPKSGVYATMSKRRGVWYQSVSFLGHRLSSDRSFAIETHVLDVDLDGDEVGECVSVAFVAFIRSNQRFENLALLQTQIAKDIQKARELLIPSSICLQS